MFTRQDMLKLLKARPFTPFRLYLSDGSVVEVRHGEVVNPGRRVAHIGITNPDNPEAPWDDWIFAYYMHVTKVESLQPGPAPEEEAPPGPSDTPAPSPA
jgi:hypothetical protein